MATAPRPTVTIEYNGKAVSEDLTPHLLGVTYTDHVKDKSDEIELSLEDVDANWRNDWYPTKGDKIKLRIGYDGNTVDCGEFDVDEIELQGPPDTISIRGVASSFMNSMRTRKSKAHENKTLKEIASGTAQALGLTLQGGDGMEKIRVTRVTQNRETDLEFLRKLTKKYGYSFAIRGSQMQCYNLEELEKQGSVIKIDRTDLIGYSFKDKAHQVYKAAVVTYHDPKTKEVIKSEYTPPPINFMQGDLLVFKKTSEDKIEIREKVENKTQADAVAKAAFHEKNSRAQTGSITVIGNPLFVAGVNFDLTGMGKLSGQFHIETSTHKVDRSGGYTCDLEIKRVADTVKKSEFKTKPEVAVVPPRPNPRPNTINYFQGDLLVFRQNS